jgi:hypothetical protein
VNIDNGFGAGYIAALIGRASAAGTLSNDRLKTAPLRRKRKR